MGNMSEEMRKVMAKWSTQEPQVVEQAEGDDNTKPCYRATIYDIVRENPGITSNKTLEVVLQRGFKQTYSSVTSQLTTLFQDYLLRREQVPNPAGVGRDVFTYYAVPEGIAATLKADHKRKQMQAKQRAERARQAKAEKAAARAAEAQQAAVPQVQIPLPLEDKMPAPAPSLQNMTAIEILNGINFSQARDLYKELKEAFGG
jgi:hypothetical protein